MASDKHERPARSTQEGPRSDPGALGDAGALIRIADALEAIVALLERRLAVDEATAEFTTLLRQGMSSAQPDPHQAEPEPWRPFEDYREGMAPGTYEVLRGEEWEPASQRDQMEIAQVQRSRRR